MNAKQIARVTSVALCLVWMFVTFHMGFFHDPRLAVKVVCVAALLLLVAQTPEKLPFFAHPSDFAAFTGRSSPDYLSFSP